MGISTCASPQAIKPAWVLATLPIYRAASHISTPSWATVLGIFEAVVVLWLPVHGRITMKEKASVPVSGMTRLNESIGCRVYKL